MSTNRISRPSDRIAHLNRLLGRPYRLGAPGLEEFDCYGLARHLQATFWGREMPLFQAPAEAGRFALAAIIAAHPERERWVRVARPVDGAIVSMAKQEIGYHMGTFVGLDGGLLVHALESPGVTVDNVFALGAMGWRKLAFWIPQPEII